MKNELLEIIINSEEPVYELDRYIFAIKDEYNFNSAWSELKEIALQGELSHRFIVLTVISENKPVYLEELASALIKDKRFAENDLILKPIVNICSVINKEEYIKFMLEVLVYAEKNKRDYLYELTLRNILTTNYWELVKEDLIKVVNNSDELTIVDLLAFFINEQGQHNYRSLIKLFPLIIQRKISELEDKIQNRFKESYKKMY